MKQYSASAARAHWFSILDEVIEGQAIPTSILDYSSLIQSPDVDNADLWTWTWDPERGATHHRLLLPELI